MQTLERWVGPDLCSLGNVINKCLLMCGLWCATKKQCSVVHIPDELLSSGPFREQLVKKAAVEKMVTMLSCYANAHGWTLGDELDIVSAIHKYRAKMHYVGISRLLEIVNLHSVAFMVIKGCVLDLLVYKGEPPREMEDVDILVASPDVPIISASLSEAGYIQGRTNTQDLCVDPVPELEARAYAQEHSELVAFHRILRAPDMSQHTSVINGYVPDGIAKAVGNTVYCDLAFDVHLNLAREFDISDVWHSPEQCLLPSKQAVSIMPADTMAWFLPVKFYHEIMLHNRPGIRQFVDIVGLIYRYYDTIDWEHVLGMACKYNLHPSLFYTFWHVNELLGPVIPWDVIENCSPVQKNVKTFHDWGDFAAKLLGEVAVGSLAWK